MAFCIGCGVAALGGCYLMIIPTTRASTIILTLGVRQGFVGPPMRQQIHVKLVSKVRKKAKRKKKTYSFVH